MLSGRHPSNLLLARTMTDTGEWPMLSGNVRENLLLFINIASKSLSKSALGSWPSNSLYRMSRYFKLGNWRIGSGNLPARRLLLRSSSNRSFKFTKLCGIVPQNRFEFKWNSARSYSNPSSCGRFPAMSPWFMSMPATVRSFGSSGAGQQNTPVYRHTSGPTQLPVMFLGSESMASFQACNAM